MKKQLSLRWKIAMYFTLLGAILILLVFVFQTLFLQPMYENEKIKSVTDVGRELTQNIMENDTEDVDDILYEASLQSDTCIRILHTSNHDFGQDMVGSGGCLLFRMRPEDIDQYVKIAEEDPNHEALIKEKFTGGMHRDDKKDDGIKNITYVNHFDTQSGEITVLVNSGISPLNATTNTLSRQLFYIAFIMAFIILLFTILIDRRIANPIRRINLSAKELHRGEYEYDQQNNRFLEVEELNETLANAAEDIQKADKAKRDLIANVSHDLRTPLTMISGYGEMMRDLPDEKTDENINVIINESNRLSALVNDLLDLSKLQENKIELQHTRVDLTDLIEKEIQKYDVYVMKEGFEIEVNALEDPAYVICDAGRIRQVFNNFMTNAINYSTDRKKIIVREVIEGDSVKISIQDFGEGMSEEDLPNIWDRYYKVDKKHVRVSSGSGLGLSIVKEILELHKAQYGVSSKEGEGSTFWFALPLDQENTQVSNA